MPQTVNRKIRNFHIKSKLARDGPYTSGYDTGSYVEVLYVNLLALVGHT